jgi:hypothetical protein
MYCTQCGSDVREKGARFCWNCGSPLPGEPRKRSTSGRETCRVVCVHVGERWSLFGKDIAEFRAIDGDGADGTFIARSEQFVVSGFDYAGPDKRNRHHERALRSLIDELEGREWKADGTAGTGWFELRFTRGLLPDGVLPDG